MVVSRVIIRGTPFRALITYSLSPLPLQVGNLRATFSTLYKPSSIQEANPIQPVSNLTFG